MQFDYLLSNTSNINKGSLWLSAMNQGPLKAVGSNPLAGISARLCTPQCVVCTMPRMVFLIKYNVVLRGN